MNNTTYKHLLQYYDAECRSCGGVVGLSHFVRHLGASDDTIRAGFHLGHSANPVLRGCADGLVEKCTQGPNLQLVRACSLLLGHVTPQLQHLRRQAPA